MPVLFTTSTCPNCPEAKRTLDASGIKYKVVDAYANKDIAEIYHVKSVPTFIPNPDEKEVVLDGVSKISSWLKDHKLA